MTITADLPVTQVRQAAPEELPALARVLTRAFADDPVTAWLWPDESNRVERLARFFADVFMERLAPGRDEIFTDDCLRGVASWTPPGQGDIAPLEMLRLLPILASVCRSRLPRALRTLAYMEAQFPEAPHWHLPFLGVSPEHQGHGLGAALMHPMLARCDREGVGAYLESSKERNVAFYGRHGFRVTQEMRFPRGPKLWLMWRDPR